MSKTIAVYIRVSTENQNLDLQKLSANQFLADVPADFIRYYIDFGVSANKVPMKQRTQLMKMLQEIKQGLISKVVTYSRDRLARNKYESLQIYEIFDKYQVEVCFTSGNSTPYQNNPIYEGFLSLFSEMEGKQISSRTKEAHNRFPSNLLGYQRINTKRTLQYQKIPIVSDKINEMFTLFASVQSIDEVMGIIDRYRKEFGKDDKRIFKMLTTPFYAGLYGENGNYSILDYVEPIIDKETFDNVQKKIQSFQNDLMRLGNQDDPGLPVPLCKVCGSTMEIKAPSAKSFISSYQCKKKHNGDFNTITVEKYEGLIQEAIKIILAKTNLELIKKETINSLGQSIAKLEQESNNLENELNELSVAIASNWEQLGSYDKSIKKFKDIKNARLEKTKLILELLSAKQMLLGIKDVMVSKESEYCKSEIVSLSKILIDRVEISPELVHVHVLFNEYWEGEQNEY